MDEIVRAALGELNGAMRGRDPAIAELFLPDALLVGSEPGEVARGRPAIATLLGAIHVKDYTVWWDLPQVDSGGSDQQVWFFAQGEVVLAGAATRRLPYRVSGALFHTAGGWRWALFHGSEPRG